MRWVSLSVRSVQSSPVHCVCIIYTAVGAGDRLLRRPQSAQTSLPMRPVPARAAGFVPIDPARPPPPPPPQQQQQPPAAPRRRRLPDIPKEEEGRDGGSVPVTAVVLRQRSVDGRRPAVRPDSGVGTADLGVAATGVLYAATAAANRDSCHSVQLPPGELPDISSFSYSADGDITLQFCDVYVTVACDY